MDFRRWRDVHQGDLVDFQRGEDHMQAEARARAEPRIVHHGCSAYSRMQ